MHLSSDALWSAATEPTLEPHLEDCARCQSTLEDIRFARSVLHLAPASPLDPRRWREIDARLEGVLRQRVQSRPVQLLVHRWGWMLPLVAAVGAVWLMARVAQLDSWLAAPSSVANKVLPTRMPVHEVSPRIAPSAEGSLTRHVRLADGADLEMTAASKVRVLEGGERIALGGGKLRVLVTNRTIRPLRILCGEEEFSARAAAFQVELREGGGVLVVEDGTVTVRDARGHVEELQAPSRIAFHPHQTRASNPSVSPALAPTSAAAAYQPSSSTTTPTAPIEDRAITSPRPGASAPAGLAAPAAELLSEMRLSLERAADSIEVLADPQLDTLPLTEPKVQRLERMERSARCGEVIDRADRWLRVATSLDALEHRVLETEAKCLIRLGRLADAAKLRNR